MERRRHQESTMGFDPHLCPVRGWMWPLPWCWLQGWGRRTAPSYGCEGFAAPWGISARRHWELKRHLGLKTSPRSSFTPEQVVDSMTISETITLQRASRWMWQSSERVLGATAEISHPCSRPNLSKKYLSGSSKFPGKHCVSIYIIRTHFWLSLMTSRYLWVWLLFQTI